MAMPAAIAMSSVRPNGALSTHAESPRVCASLSACACRYRPAASIAAVNARPT